MCLLEIKFVILLSGYKKILNNMLSQIIDKSRHRMECVNNYMMPRIDEIVALLRLAEHTLGEDYELVFKKRKNFLKGNYLLKEGTISKDIWFLEEGIARRFYYNDGIEYTDNFFFPCEFVDCFATASLELPSRFSIQLLTNAVVRVIDRDELLKLEIKYPFLKELWRLLIACNVLWLEERLYSLQQLSATERYLQVLKKQPQIIKEIPLTYIAFYLGVSVETLSRIRAKFKVV